MAQGPGTVTDAASAAGRHPLPLVPARLPSPAPPLVQSASGGAAAHGRTRRTTAATCAGRSSSMHRDRPAPGRDRAAARRSGRRRHLRRAVLERVPYHERRTIRTSRRRRWPHELRARRQQRQWPSATFTTVHASDQRGLSERSWPERSPYLRVVGEQAQRDHAQVGGIAAPMSCSRGSTGPRQPLAVHPDQHTLVAHVRGATSASVSARSSTRRALTRSRSPRRQRSPAAGEPCPSPDHRRTTTASTDQVCTRRRRSPCCRANISGCSPASGTPSSPTSPVMTPTSPCCGHREQVRHRLDVAGALERPPAREISGKACPGRSRQRRDTHGTGVHGHGRPSSASGSLGPDATTSRCGCCPPSRRVHLPRRRSPPSPSSPVGLSDARGVRSSSG